MPGFDSMSELHMMQRQRKNLARNFSKTALAAPSIGGAASLI